MVLGLGLAFGGIQSESVNQTGAGHHCSEQTQCARDLSGDRAELLPGRAWSLEPQKALSGLFQPR